MGMMISHIELSMVCGACGRGHVIAPHSDDDEARVSCSHCHTDLGAWAEVKEQARAAMFDALRDDFRAPLDAIGSTDHAADDASAEWPRAA